MGNSPDYHNKFNLLNCCLIIPTYNNHKTLKRVIDGVLQYTDNIIIVNDGSTDATSQILAGYPKIITIHHESNRGKGKALRTGFKACTAKGYDYAITIDSDGQHFPDDIPVFIDALEEESGLLLIGSRNMEQEDVPKKSSFGNKFSNFWFWFETGIKLEDTQSGYRLYPLKSIPSKFFTNKFEFEIEVIVRAAWKGVQVENVPVRVLYDPDERVSHFRPFKDFTRISILNTIFVIISLLYIKPRNFITGFRKKGFRRFFLENILESGDSPSKKAVSIALGVFIGIAPFWGFQTVLVLSLAYILRLNKVIAFAFSNISVPPMIPLIIFASLKTGALFVNNGNHINAETATTFEVIQQNLVQYITGSFILAAIISALFGISGYFLLCLKGKADKNG